MKTESTNKYFAFISYKREDEEWAIWLQHELEYYHLPALLNGREDLPKVFRPVFRDIDELKAGNLPEQIHEALASSSHLIVICSPRSAKSEWVNKEIEAFIEIGKEKGINNLEHVFPFIVEGKPHAEDKAQECFPKALRDLPADKERIGGNVNENGRDKAFIKVMAGMLPNVGMDMLWNRYERDKAEEERRKREERDKLYISQSRFIAEKAINLIEEGDSYTARRLLLEVLPKDLMQPNKPLTPEAEHALRKACNLNNAILRGHSTPVKSVVFNPDGKCIISTSPEGYYIWDFKSGKPLCPIWQLVDVSSIVSTGSSGKLSFPSDLSQDGKLFIFTSDNNRTITIWDLSKDKETLSLSTPIVRSIAFSPNGDRFASVSKDNIIRVWDTSNGMCLLSFQGHVAQINSVAFSPDNKQIITSSNDKTIRLWDTVSGKELMTYSGHTHTVFSAVFNKDGNRIVSASMDKTVRVWDTKSGKELQSFVGHSSRVYSAHFSPDGKRIVSSSMDKTVRVWDIESGMELGCLSGHKAEVYHSVFSPDGKSIISASQDKTIRIWDIKTIEKTKSIPHIGHNDNNNPNKRLAVSPNGKQIATITPNGTIRISDANTKEILRSISSSKAFLFSIAYSSDGKRLVSTSIDKTIRIWDSESGIELLSLVGHTLAVTYAAFSNNDKWIVSTSRDKTIRIWDAKTGIELKRLSGHTDTILSASFSPDGKNILSDSKDNTIRIWDIEFAHECYIFDKDIDSVASATFAPDGKHIILVSKDGTIRIWPFPPLQELIDQTRERFKNRPLTPEERRMYYFE